MFTEWKRFFEVVSKETNSKRLIILESLGDSHEHTKHFVYKDIDVSPFRINFQPSYDDSDPIISVANMRILSDFKPDSIKSLVDNWLTCKNARYFHSNWEVRNFFHGI